MVIVLQAVDALGILTAAVDPLQVVAAHAPVVLDGVDVLDDLGEEGAVEAVARVQAARLRFEQVLYPGIYNNY